MSNEAQPQTQPVSQVEEYQAALQEQIDDYDEKLSRLEARLEKVLQPVGNPGAEPDGKGTTDPLCPLADWLRIKQSVMGTINGRLDHLLEHLML